MSVGSEAASGSQRMLMRIDTRGAMVDAGLGGVKEGGGREMEEELQSR